MTEQTNLTLGEGVLLGHALVEGAARMCGSRVLFIKGPHQDALELRSPRQSVDVDALAHPADAGFLRAELLSAGWTARVPSTAARVLPLHSVTLACEGWPCEIDLHHTFPGFFYDPVTTFEALWQRRQKTRFAGVEVSVPDVVGSILITALHLERDPAQRAPDIEHLRHRATDLLGKSGLEDLSALAHATGASDSLREFLMSLGAPLPDQVASPQDLTAWQIRRASNGMPGVGWLYQFSRANSLRQRVHWISRGLLSTEAELRQSYPWARRGPVGLLQARWWRLKRTLRHLPRAICLVLRAARGRKSPPEGPLTRPEPRH